MKDYQYILTYGATTETLGFNPAGYDKLGITWMRHEVYHSVLRSFTLSLRFVNINRGGLTGGYQLIKQAYDTEGIYAEVSIEIKKRNPDTNDYDSLYTGVLDFTPGRWTIDRDLFWEIAINDSSVLQKFISRDENEINLFADKTIGNISITKAVADEVNLDGVLIVLEAIKSSYIATMQSITPSNSKREYYLELTLVQPSNEKNEIGDDLTIVGDGVIYTNNTSLSQYFSMQFTNDGNFTIVRTGFTGISRLLQIRLYLRSYDSLNVLQDTYTILSRDENYSTNGTSVLTQTFTTQYNNDVLVPAGGYVVLDAYAQCNAIDSSEKIDFTYNTGTILNTGFQTTTPDVTPTLTKCLFPLKAFTKAIEIIIDTDIDVECDLMDSGGDLEFDAIMAGRQIRLYPEPDVFIKFRDLFKTFDFINNLGLWHDKLNNKFIIDNKYSFYKSELLFELQSVSKFKIQPLQSAYYGKIECGFDNSGEYEIVQGAKEFAVAKEYSTSATVKETKNIKCPYRCDSIGIRQLRNMQYNTMASEDNNDDNSIFIVRTDGTWPVKSGDITTEFFSYYNTMFTPRQNAVRWGNVIKACCYHNTNPIQAQKTEKQFELEVDGIDENSDITVSELSEALFVPELYVFESYLTPTMIQSLLTDPHGYIKFQYNGVDYEGYVNKIELTDNNRKANFELIARDIITIYRTFTDGSNHYFKDGTQMISA